MQMLKRRRWRVAAPDKGLVTSVALIETVHVHQVTRPDSAELSVQRSIERRTYDRLC